MKTLYYTATSLDGYIADAGNSLDWLLQFDDVEGMEEAYPRFIEQVGAAAMGPTTYEWVVRHEHLTEHPQRWPYAFPVWVFTSRDLQAVRGADVRFVRGAVEPVHAAMAEAAGGRIVWLVGGGDLVGQFYDAGLLDEIIVTVAPVTLGAGKPLLPRRISDPPLRLVAARTYGEVFAELTYAVR